MKHRATRRPGACPALTGIATGWLEQSGMRVAMIETGGGPAHG